MPATKNSVAKQTTLARLSPVTQKLEAERQRSSLPDAPQHQQRAGDHVCTAKPRPDPIKEGTYIHTNCICVLRLLKSIFCL